MLLLDRFFDVLNFKFLNKKGEPEITIGSIMFGGFIRVSIILTISYYAIDLFNLYKYWFIILFIIWFLVLYPGYNEYTKMELEVEKVTNDTLCGTCTHFDNRNQLCKLYDTHITTEVIPCEGNDWEYKNEYDD